MVVMKFQTQQDYFGYVKMENKKYLILLVFIFIIPFANAPTEEFFEDCSGGNLGLQWTVGDWAEGSGGDSGWCWITETGTVKNMTSNTIDLSSGDIAYANLTFDTNHVGFNGNDYFYVWIKNSTTTVQLLESTGGAKSLLSFSFNLSEHITLDASVQIIGGCLTIGKNDDCRWDNINITSYPIPAGDSCIYTSGTWEISLSDNCVIDDLQDASGNTVIVSGSSGSLTIASGGEIRCNDFHFTPSDFNGDAIFNVQTGGKFSCGM